MNPMRAKWGVKPGAVFTPDQWTARWNGMLEDYDRLVPQIVLREGQGGSPTHPWKTGTKRFDDGTHSMLTWRIDVALGTILDVPPTLIYLAQNDPRGWKPDPKLAITSPIVERSMAEYDAPWILLKTPKPGSAPMAPPPPSDQFVEVGNDGRPAFFRTEAMWEKRLYRASVFLTDTPAQQVAYDFPAQYIGRLKKQIRLAGGRLPVNPIGTAGGLLELARLFLLRDPDEKDGSGDSIVVQQKVFRPVWSALTVPVDPSGGEAGDAAAADFEAGAEYDFWSA